MSSLLRNSTLETVFRPFPIKGQKAALRKITESPSNAVVARGGIRTQKAPPQTTAFVFSIFGGYSPGKILRQTTTWTVKIHLEINHGLLFVESHSPPDQKE